ncbi:MAG TPA: T9SS type A sorting domain-containing protein [Chitinophagales bacterium]|nr:T9SS type A sorting domain-containing protein [Chitinophagales bacterium]
MKPNYTLSKLLTALAIVAGCILCRAQGPLESLTANNVNAGIGIGGNLFSNTQTQLETFSHFEVPKGSDIKPYFTAALWLTATDPGNTLRCAAQRYCGTGHDFFDGPMSPNYSPAYYVFYNRVFKVSRSQIERHMALPQNSPVSVMDSAILFWPAKNNPHVATSYGVGILSPLAPFIDADGDGQYNPVHGDVPDICGDEAIFFVFNDVGGTHAESGGAALGIEVRGLAEVFLDSSFGGFNAPPVNKRAINNTVFVHYEIQNKASIDLLNVKAGMFADVDLGCFSNDLVGCDTNRNLIFAYNGTMPDYDCNGTTGYKSLDAATGIKLLNSRYTSFNYLINGGTYNTDPSTAPQYQNYLNGQWLDTIPFTVGGNGHGGSVPTSFIYPGNPSNPNEWSEISTNQQAGDRRMVGGSSHGSLLPGNILTLDYAFITSMDSTADNLTIVDTLKQDADRIQAFYDNTLATCRAHITTAVAEINTLAMSVYPNPASSVLMIEAPATINLVEVRDMLGRTVISQKTDTQKVLLNVSALAKGIYLLKADGSGKTAVKKIVVE